MPAAKMLADSTQSDAALERKKRRRDEKDYHRKSTTRDEGRSRHSRSPHRTSNNSSSSRRSAVSHSEKFSPKDVDSDCSDMDLQRPLKPISSYIKNRSEMLDQMFSCIKGSTLKRAIPDDLQSMNYQELKQRCLAQLEVMSKKRILRILAGDEPANISSSGTEESGDDVENTDKKMTMNPPESSQPFSYAESHPADSTSSSSAQRTKSSSNTNRNLSLVNPSHDRRLLPQTINMPHLDNQSLNIQVAGYSLQTMGTGLSTSCPESHAAAGSHWLRQFDQPSVSNLPAEAGHLQPRPHISPHLLPTFRHTLELDCSDVPINIAPPHARKVNHVSILSSSQQHRRQHHQHQQHHRLQQHSQQWNATGNVRPFACSGSDYCVCGRCSAPALLSQATAATASSGVAATEMIGVCSDARTPAIPGSIPGSAVAGQDQTVPTRVLARTQMEILELEMRARAIKAMLHAASHCPPLQQQQQPPPSL